MSATNVMTSDFCLGSKPAIPATVAQSDESVGHQVTSQPYKTKCSLVVFHVTEAHCEKNAKFSTNHIGAKIQILHLYSIYKYSRLPLFLSAYTPGIN